jgi:hypothetical protein
MAATICEAKNKFRLKHKSLINTSDLPAPVTDRYLSTIGPVVGEYGSITVREDAVIRAAFASLQ